MHALNAKYSFGFDLSGLPWLEKVPWKTLVVPSKRAHATPDALDLLEQLLRYEGAFPCRGLSSSLFFLVVLVLGLVTKLFYGRAAGFYCEHSRFHQSFHDLLDSASHTSFYLHTYSSNI
jgi:hypothetical protein